MRPLRTPPGTRHGGSLVLALLVAVLGAHGAVAEVTRIAPVRDNTLFQDSTGTTSDGAGPALFGGKNGQGALRRALLAFDVASQVPAGAVIDSVVLSLHVSNAPNAILRTFTVHQVARAWGEGGSYATGGTGAPATAGDATWLHTFYPDARWTSAGGDFATFASATAAVGDTGSYQWRGADLTADVQFWLRQPTGDFGWLLEGEEGATSSARRFDSREADVPAQRPSLTIYYRMTGAGVPQLPGVEPMELGPGVPNPSAGSVRIELTLRSSARGRLVIEDVEGRRVAALSEGSLPAGRHLLRWNGCGAEGETVKPGVYFYRFVSGHTSTPARRLAVRR